jgi:hypothetical protein
MCCSVAIVGFDQPRRKLAPTPAEHLQRPALNEAQVAQFASDLERRRNLFMEVRIGRTFLAWAI